MLGLLSVSALLLSRWLAVTLIHTPSAIATPAAKASMIPIPEGLNLFDLACFITSLPDERWHGTHRQHKRHQRGYRKPHYDMPHGRSAPFLWRSRFILE